MREVGPHGDVWPEGQGPSGWPDGSKKLIGLSEIRRTLHEVEAELGGIDALHEWLKASMSRRRSEGELP